MDYQLSHAYEESIELRAALETLHHDILNQWPLPSATPRDICDAIRAAFSRQRETADAGQRGLWDGGAGS